MKSSDCSGSTLMLFSTGSMHSYCVSDLETVTFCQFQHYLAQTSSYISGFGSGPGLLMLKLQNDFKALSQPKPLKDSLSP